MSRQRNQRSQRKPRIVNEGWIPKTKLGELVQSGLITLDKIFANNLVVKEKEIINVLLPQLKESVVTINMVQQMTASGQRSRFKAVVIVGADGFIGIGSAKSSARGGDLVSSICVLFCDDILIINNKTFSFNNVKNKINIF